ncbi:hypothetical protein [Bacillus sp. 165]|uniref:hypothetical protein n=1 Tax=Bacillus sp. 165 TaxID=1529117 RepID=UPI001ADB623A|nr:hypothetical protein [Bacillus sp. 165]MBO9128977.1 hypothetical protein [Bacillus sp. 165]
MNKRKPLIYVLSFLPGLGHFYLGLMNRGLQFMLMFFGTIFFVTSVMESLALFLPVIVFYSYFDVLRLYRMYREMEEVPDEPFIQYHIFQDKKYIIGWVLIIFGLFSILKHSMYHLPQSIAQYVSYDFVQNVVLGVIFIILGYRLLRGKKEKQV